MQLAKVRDVDQREWVGGIDAHWDAIFLHFGKQSERVQDVNAMFAADNAFGMRLTFKSY